MTTTRMMQSPGAAALLYSHCTAALYTMDQSHMDEALCTWWKTGLMMLEHYAAIHKLQSRHLEEASRFIMDPRVDRGFLTLSGETTG